MSQKQNSTAGDPDYFEQLRKLQEQQSTGWQSPRQPDWPSTQPQPCPDCGSCPTCGRRGRYTITYGYPGYIYL